jgi:alkanesulfonate monooxygenase SsuD/methylene tetrahydromethanopterin reductase-like flavin-dependent oxidoreductase (luciferase family)
MPGSPFNVPPGGPAVRLSAFTVVDGVAPGPAGPRDRLGEVLDLGPVADAAGLSTLWVAEHHFHDGGLCPAPPVLLAALAARTRRLRLGALVSVLPFHNPIEVAEQYALVDRLSGGRLDLGVGSGYIPLELEGFGVDPSTKRDRFDRSFDTVLAALRGEPVRWGGAEVRLNVRPVQTPHPPVVLAVQRREAVPFVARRGIGLALIPYATVSGPAELAEEIREYRAALPDGRAGHVAIGLHLYAGDHPDRARAALNRYLDARLAHHSPFFERKAAAAPAEATVEGIERQGFALFGSPRDVGERVAEFERLGVDEVLGIFDFGGLAPSDVHGSIRSLGPRFAPG